MSPKEKATELFYKFSSFNTYNLDKECCKKSATFLVEEIERHIRKSTPKDDPYLNLTAIEYWDEVINEIEKI